MNEMNQNLPPTLRSAMDAFYTAPQPEDAFAERLEAQLRRRHIDLLADAPAAASPKQKSGSLLPAHRGSFNQLLLARPMMAVIAVLLAVLLLTGIAYAVGRLTGFIPGIGFVEDVQSVLETPIVVKRDIVNTPTVDPSGQTITTPVMQISPSEANAEPQSKWNPTPLIVQEQKGITITIEQVVAETDRLVIAYKVSGLPPNLFGFERAEALQSYNEKHPDEPMPQQIRLPDGTFLDHASGGHCGGAGDGLTSWLSCQTIYAPLPEGVSQITFEIHRLDYALPGELPEDWSFPIQLTPISSSLPAHGIQEPDLRSQPVNGITLRLLKAVQSPAETAFQLGMEWQGASRAVFYTAPITLQDAQGRYYVLTGGPDNGLYSIDNPNFATLPSLVTTPVDGSSPLTFHVDWVAMSASTYGSGVENSAAILKFDPGNASKIGQEWVLDQTFRAGDFDLHFTKARLKSALDGTLTLEFDIQAPSDVIMVNLMPKEGNASIESGYDPARGVMVSRVTLPELPTHPIDLYLSEIIYKVNGPWEITWQPQRENTPISTATPAPTRLAPPAPTLVPGEPLLTEVQELLSRAPVLTGPGWIHQVMQIDQAAPPVALDTGDQLEQPLNMRIDAWFRLDSQGHLQSSVYIRKSLDGKTLSVDVTNGVYHFSLPEGRGGISDEIYISEPSYYQDFLSTLNGYVGEGGSIRQEWSVVDGKSCRLYSGVRVFAPTMVFSNEPAPVRAMIHSACMDPTTGVILQIQNQMIYSDGTTRIKDTTRFISLEKVNSLPGEVQEWLDKIVMP